jgi:hypothetical protein
MADSYVATIQDSAGKTVYPVARYVDLLGAPDTAAALALHSWHLTDPTKLHADVNKLIAKCNVWIYRVGRLVLCYGTIQMPAKTDLMYKGILTIPAGYAPNADTPSMMGSAAAAEAVAEGDNFAKLGLGVQSGRLQSLLNNPGSARNFGFNLAWITDDDYPA